MTAPPRAPQPVPKRPGPLRRAEPFIVLYIALAAIPVGLWRAAENPLTATLPYLNLNQAELFWNTLQADPSADAPEFALAAIDLAWIIWAPFALAAALQLLVTVFHIPRTAIPHILLRLTPTTVVSVMVTGTAAAAQAPAGAVHATTLPHHHLRHGYERGDRGMRGHSALEAQVRKAIAHCEHQRHHGGAGAHTVQEGETLWAIAKDAYGEGQDWPEIYDANLGRTEQGGDVLANPELIQPGWTLTVPRTGVTMPPPHTTRATPAPPRPTTGSDGPAATAATSATPRPVAPETPTPAATGHRPVPSAGARRVPPDTATAANRANRPPNPAHGPRAHAPWTTGLDLPDGGYIGITLLMAAAGATLTLRRLARRTGHDPQMPRSVEQLTVIATRAEMAATGDWDPELETEPNPPPLLRPRPEHLVFGTAPTGSDEAILEPEHHPLTVYTGPSAHDAAAALALSALASQPPHRLVTTETLAHQLIGAAMDPHDPDWLVLLPDTAAALNAAADRAGNAEGARTLVIADAQSATTFQISAALAADRGHNGLAILLIGDPGHLAAHPLTSIMIDDEGRPSKVTGPRAAAFAGTRFHTVPRPMAADLYTTLRHDRAARTAQRIPAQTHGEHHARLADQHPESDPADDERHQDATAPPAAPEEAEPDPPATPLTGTSTSASAVRRTPPTGSPATPAPLRAPILLRILGPLVFENTSGQTRPGPGGRNAQLLTYLALHPRGRTLQQITTAIWNNGGPGGPNRTLVRLRQELHTVITELAPDHIPEDGEDVQSVIREPHGTYHLNHRLIRTDHADFTQLETEARTEHNPARRTELAAQALAHVRGDLAEGVSDLDQTWLLDERTDLDDRTASLATISQSSDLTVEATPRTTPTTSTAATTVSQ
ncbi:LysM peptidoglycan-binding domain-containing protein [Actinospica robiniae]|uniref:LysM peptidoglycan-binding domain-containing protein n=1 Tax=Actinospica robiniae TaxID=304901 RepID=UPI000550E956|nr:LysM peptidoglycan-binding domain-containing protein [Actinospica robiniae]